jgi:hypothetical protein
VVKKLAPLQYLLNILLLLVEAAAQAAAMEREVEAAAQEGI